MTDISMEAHEAMQQKAVTDAVAATDAALAKATTDAADAIARADLADKAAADLKTDNERLNKELDEAQVKIKAAEDRASAAEDELKKSKEDAALSEVASKRLDQVKALNLFPEDFITERAERWSKQSEEDWASQVAEWQTLKPAQAGSETPNGDQASALTGASTDGLSTEKTTDSAAAGDTTKPSPRRLALGLRAKA